jgi:hypothetical protein
VRKPKPKPPKQEPEDTAAEPVTPVTSGPTYTPQPDYTPPVTQPQPEPEPEPEPQVFSDSG